MKVTREEVNKLLSYDEISGVLMWRISRGNRKFGEEAGTVTVTHAGKSYRQIIINGKHYLAHRLAWLLLTGEFPAEQIDHIDGDGLNNAAENLRAVSGAENHKNTRKPATNTSGIAGVCWHKRYSKWVAQIRINGRRIHLGYFESFDDAAKARKDADIKYGFQENHGCDRPL